MELKRELQIIKELGFVEIKPLLYCIKETQHTLYFDYRKNNKRHSYALDDEGLPCDKNEFKAYNEFKIIEKNQERKSTPKIDLFTLSQEIDDWVEDFNTYKKNSPLEGRAKFMLSEVKKRIELGELK